MTAKKGKGRGMVARLEALEEREAARREEVRARNWAQLQRAFSFLPPEDRAALEDLGVMEGEGPDAATMARIGRALEGMPEGLGVTADHPAKEEALAWAWAALDAPDNCPLRPPPVGRVEDFAAYFEAEALAYAEEARRVPLSPDVHRAASWCRALSRMSASLCRVLGRA